LPHDAEIYELKEPSTGIPNETFLLKEGRISECNLTALSVSIFDGDGGGLLEVSEVR
jgi:hypothetical protein